jgi:hypothetical protein
MLSRARRRVLPSKEQVGDQEDMGSMRTPQSSEGGEYRMKIGWQQ